MNLDFDTAETANMLISALIGLCLAYFATWSYENFQNKRLESKQRATFQHLESKNCEFDWRHWDVKGGKIVDKPIDSFKRLKYLHDGEFEFEWIEKIEGEVIGTGRLIFDNKIKGILHFFDHTTINYKYRNVFYRSISHFGKKYDAIFVDAQDEGTKYVLMRESK